MPSDRRGPSASASSSRSREPTFTSRRAQGSMRSMSSGSITPIEEEDDDDTPRRSTRGRNPLPPTKGPLFPPLPPKQPKNPNISSPVRKTPSSTPQIQPAASFSTPVVNFPSSLTAAESEKEVLEPAGDIMELDEKVDFLNASNASLTPPPPSSEDLPMDEDPDPDPDPDLEQGEGGWEEYRKHRAIRGFGEVKVEPPDQGEEGGEEITPGRTNGNPKRPPPRPVVGSGASPSVSESSRTQQANRKRRGEGALLLDDHLLPEEMRKTGSLTGKRGRGSMSKASNKGVMDKDEPEPEPEDQEVEDTVRAKEERLEDIESPGGVLDTEITLVGQEEKEDIDGEDEVQGEEEDDEDEDEDDSSEVTRCVCHLDHSDVMMIQCDSCNVWQHGPCIGIWEDEEAPAEYYCEECRIDLHGPLKRWIRSCGRNPALFVPPTPEDLKRLHHASDKIPPSQSKRWTDADLMSSPPLKPASRSHHKKEQITSPVETKDEGRRSHRGRVISTSEKPTSSNKDQESSKSARPAPVAPSVSHKRKSSLGGVHTASPERSISPSTGMHHPPKRRITMNSRDSTYEQQVQAALEASRVDMRSASVEIQDDDERKGLGDKEEEVERVKKGKRKRDNDETGSVEPSPNPGNLSKAKHPNQYTYRLKPPSSSNAPPAIGSPARRAVGTPVPSLPPPQHDHGTRRAGAMANGAIANPTLTAQSATALNWYLPEHLSAYGDVLPSAQPTALDVRSARILPSTSRNYYHNLHYGPFTEERDENGRLVLPDPLPLREPLGEPETHMEPPARVKYPVKRMTLVEMKKRVRNLLDYIGKVEKEEAGRTERAKLFGIVVTPLEKKKPVEEPEEESETEPAAPQETEKFEQAMGMDLDTEGGKEPIIPAASVLDPAVDLAVVQQPEKQKDELDIAPDPPERTAAQLMEDLKRDLLAFQGELFAPTNPALSVTIGYPSANGNGTGTGLGLGININMANGHSLLSPISSPVPPTTSTLEAAPLSALEDNIKVTAPVPEPELDIAMEDKIGAHILRKEEEVSVDPALADGERPASEKPEVELTSTVAAPLEEENTSKPEMGDEAPPQVFGESLVSVV